jgi:hypothetical protein
MRRSRTDVALGRHLTIGQHWQHPDRGVWRVRNVHRMDCLVDLEHTDTRQRDTLTFAQLRADWTQPARPGDVDWDRSPAPAPRGLHRDAAHITTPCPQCSRGNVFKFTSDTGLFYQCADCLWATFESWVDYAQRQTRAKAHPVLSDEQRAQEVRQQMPLPTQKQSRAGKTPLNVRVLLAGTPKVGKSTLAAQWAPDETLMIDDVWHFVDRHCAGKKAVLATATEDYNRSAKTAEGTFRMVIGKLLATDLGVWFLTHTKSSQDDGVTRYTAKLDKAVLTYVQGACEVVLLAESLGNGVRRTLHTAPTAKFEAGSRIPLPEPMDLDARALYAAMQRGLKTQPAAPAAAPAEKNETTNTERAAA